MCNLSLWEGWQAGYAAAAAAAAVALGVSAIDPCRIGDTLGGLLSCTGYVAGSRKAAKIAGGVSEASNLITPPAVCYLDCLSFRPKLDSHVSVWEQIDSAATHAGSPKPASPNHATIS